MHLDAVLGQEHIVEYLKDHMKKPFHLMFLGPPGTGKTFISRLFIKDYLDSMGILPKDRDIYVLQLKSTDDRGIAMVRNRLAEFVKRVRPNKEAVAWVWLDDADSLPIVSQQALRRILERYEAHARFLFCANGPEPFIEPLQSRCTILQFLPVNLIKHGGEILKRQNPNLRLSQEAMSWLISMSLGNARLYQHYLQTLCVSVGTKNTIEASEAQSIVNTPPVGLLSDLGFASLSGDRTGIVRNFLRLWSAGYSFEDIIAFLETICKTYSFYAPEDAQKIYALCGEGHVAMILNRVSFLDALIVLSGGSVTNL
jgi:replication-associated recombination protein RarA